MENKNIDGLISRIYIAERQTNLNNYISRIQKSKVRQQRKMYEYRGKHYIEKNKKCSKLAKIIGVSISAIAIGYTIGTIIINNID